MDSQALLLDAYDRIGPTVRASVEGLNAEALAYRPETDANSIAWLIWHLTRVQDHHMSEIADREQAWTSDGWAQKFNLDPDPHDIGYGHTSEQVASIRPDDPQILLDYHDAVAARSKEYLATVDATELDRIIDRSYDPPVTVGVRLVSLINDSTQHVGQARYLRGIVERLGI